MRRAVLVNGVPASGKSTVARPLAARLGVPFLELDAVKEVLFEELGHRDADRDWGRALGRASLGSIWALLAGFPDGALVVIDAWLRRPPHDAVLAGLASAGVDRWVELWCHADIDVLISRYTARSRHPGHPAAADYEAELRELAAVAGPTGQAPSLAIDTVTGQPGIDAVIDWIGQTLELDLPARPAPRDE